MIGAALKRHNVPRRSYYLHSKVGRYTADVRTRFDFSRDRTLASVDESLARLGVDFIDCMQGMVAYRVCPFFRRRCRLQSAMRISPRRAGVVVSNSFFAPYVCQSTTRSSRRTGGPS